MLFRRYHENLCCIYLKVGKQLRDLILLTSLRLIIIIYLLGLLSKVINFLKVLILNAHLFYNIKVFLTDLFIAKLAVTKENRCYYIKFLNIIIIIVKKNFSY